MRANLELELKYLPIDESFDDDLEPELSPGGEGGGWSLLQ